MSGFWDFLRGLQRALNDDALLDMAIIIAYLQPSHHRVGAMFYKLGQPLRSVLHRWASSSSARGQLLYEGAGIAVHAIGYLLILGLYVFGGSLAVPDIPGDDDEDSDPSSRKLAMRTESEYDEVKR